MVATKAVEDTSQEVDSPRAAMAVITNKITRGVGVLVVADTAVDKVMDLAGTRGREV